jgi:hypothetical protein
MITSQQRKIQNPQFLDHRLLCLIPSCQLCSTVGSKTLVLHRWAWAGVMRITNAEWCDASCKCPTWRTIPFSVCLFQFSTCLEQPRAHHHENRLYQYNIWYVSLCVGDCLVCSSGRNFSTCILDGHLHRVTHTRCCIDTTDSLDDEHEFARNM